MDGGFAFMGYTDNNCAQIDENGHLILPPEIVSRYRLKPGIKILLDDNENGLHLSSPTRLAKLYIEPTNRCNLDCRTCIRNVWDESFGMMSDAVFDRIIRGLKAFSPPPTVFFGGFGEPLLHPKIIEMVTRAKEMGARVELITNGTLLTQDLSYKLLWSGLDLLWVSLDGATPESYADIRLGAELTRVIENISGFNKATYAEGAMTCCSFIPKYKTQLGIEFVATKSNIADLPDVLNLGKLFGAKRFIVTNVLPYTKEMCDEILYRNSLGDSGTLISMPRMDENDITRGPLSQAARNIYVNPFNSNMHIHINQCPFIQSGSGAICWDGGLSPCLSLLHSHTSYTPNHKRFSRKWVVGNISERDLSDLWECKENTAFREKVQAFDFPSCTSCGGCLNVESNEEDCFGNTFPTCGGCLWAQGLIRCP
jgi:MoaA/NifB/PqqE/SkfB family radical SAM enzyme